MAFLIRGVNLDTNEAWDEKTDLTEEEARERIQGLRRLRGNWRTNPVVYAMVDPETKRAHKPSTSLYLWALAMMQNRHKPIEEVCDV